MTSRNFFQILRPITLLRPIIPDKTNKISHVENILHRQFSSSTKTTINKNTLNSLSTCSLKEVPLTNKFQNITPRYDSAILRDAKLLTKLNDVFCRNQESKLKILDKSRDQARYFCIAAYPKKYTSENLLDLRQKTHQYNRRYGSKKSSEKSVSKCKCKAPKDPNCQKRPPKFKMEYCVKPFREDCELKDPICPPRKEAPYGSYSECMSGWYEDALSECINTDEILLQPKKQKSKHIDTFKAPPPKWAPINPAIERNCLKEHPIAPAENDDDDPNEEHKNWKNPCPQFKLKICKKRYRQFCGYPDAQKCKKVDAPYPSFTDYCPQFPDVQMSECDLAERRKNEQKVSYSGKSMKIKIEKVEFEDQEDPCKTPTAAKSKKKALQGPKCRQKVEKRQSCDKVKFPFKKTKCESSKS